MLDADSTASVAPPNSVADDAALPKDGRNKLGYAAIATVREDTSVFFAKHLDHGAAVVDRIVPIAGASCGRGDDSA